MASVSEEPSLERCHGFLRQVGDVGVRNARLGLGVMVVLFKGDE